MINNNYHPSQWSIEELVTYIYEVMHWDIDAITLKTKQELIDLVEREESDKNSGSI